MNARQESYSKVFNSTLLFLSDAILAVGLTFCLNMIRKWPIFLYIEPFLPSSIYNLILIRKVELNRHPFRQWNW